MTHKQVEEYIRGRGKVQLDYPFGEQVAVYKTDGKMFALVAEGSTPVRISLKCDPQLSELLRQEYESVMPGYHLNKKHWITVVMSGQLNWQQVKDLIDHSYNLVKS